MKPRARAFTLIELLVVMAIMIVLASLAVVATRRARESAWKAACASNLRNLHTAVRYYAADHDGRMPNLRWNTQYLQISLLAPYVREEWTVFSCPASVRRDDLWPAWKLLSCTTTGAARVCTTYKMNDNEAVAGKSIFAIKRPSWLVVVMDTDWADQARHMGKDNVAFLDGHVEAKSREELMGSDPDGRTPWWWWGTGQ
jgi:prepilin-type processing-associated H-X9-DG protein/prepilin-type N-terminal cleavage/methylation domain-containing protein